LVEVQGSGKGQVSFPSMLPPVPIDTWAGRALELAWMFCGREALADTRKETQ